MNPVVSPELERIARQASEDYLRNLLPGMRNTSLTDEEFQCSEMQNRHIILSGRIKKAVLSALALQVEKEKKSENLGSETPLPLGQQSEETNGNPFGGIICAACPLDVGVCPLCGTYWVRYEDKRIGYRRN